MTIFRIERTPRVCDFCFHPKPVTAYQCEDFMWEKDSILPHESKGAWSACAKCAELIDAGKWMELTDRCLAEFYHRHGVPMNQRPMFRAAIKQLHEQFRAHMRRPA